MEDIISKITKLEDKIETASADLEKSGRLGEALHTYEGVERTLEKFGLMPFHDGYREAQRVLAACLDHQSAVLERLGRTEEAGMVGERQLVAARRSGDLISLAQALGRVGAARLTAGDPQGGLHAIEESERLFTSGDSLEHKTGLGLYCVTRAELINSGLIKGGPRAAIRAAEQAIIILTPLGHQEGLRRGTEARSIAQNSLGDSRSS